MDHEPTVWPIEWGELLEFCNSAGYRCRLEPAGSLLIPPDYNVGMTDWEKSLKLRKGEFSVLGAEPLAAGHPAAAASGLFLDGPDWIFESAAVGAHGELLADAALPLGWGGVLAGFHNNVVALLLPANLASLTRPAPASGWPRPSAAADEEEVQAEQLSAVIDSQLASPAQLEAMRASLERLLPHE
jgi:hypothetical protein